MNLPLKPKTRLQHLKSIIKTWLEDRFAAGAALMEIRDDKLWMEDHDSFEEFCQKEYNLQHTQAYGIIRAYEVKAALGNSAIAEKLTNEGQARELGKVDEEDREEVLEEAAKSGKVTAKSIKEAAEKREIQLDKLGSPIPEEILQDWQRAEQVSPIMHKLSEIRSYVKRGLDDEDLILAEINQQVIADLNNAYRFMKNIAPYSVCPTCQGLQRDSCRLCKKRGFISKFLYDAAIPEELKAMKR